MTPDELAFFDFAWRAVAAFFAVLLVVDVIGAAWERHRIREASRQMCRRLAKYGQVGDKR